MFIIHFPFSKIPPFSPFTNIFFKFPRHFYFYYKNTKPRSQNITQVASALNFPINCSLDMRLRLIPPVGSASARGACKIFPTIMGWLSQPPVLGVLFHLTAHTLAPDPVQITPYHSIAFSFL